MTEVARDLPSTALRRLTPLEHCNVPEPTGLLVERGKRRTSRRAEDPAVGMDVRLEPVDEPEPGVDGVPAEADPPCLPRNAQRQQPPRMERRRADERLRVGIAANHSVHDHY